MLQNNKKIQLSNISPFKSPRIPMGCLIFHVCVSKAAARLQRRGGQPVFEPPVAPTDRFPS